MLGSRSLLLPRSLASTALILLALGVLLVGCGRRSAPVPCFDDGDCGGGGEVEACVEGNCQAVDCLTSLDCAIGSWCDNERSEDGSARELVCVDGCQGDPDCLAGTDCQEGVCLERPCRSTQLDCGMGEVCDETTGACEPAGAAYCAPCDSTLTTVDDGGTAWDPCDDHFLGHPECGGIGSFCIGDGSGDTFCAPDCELDVDCPQGYACAVIQSDLTALCGDPPGVVEHGRGCAPVMGCY